jgi:hypothetical protein
MRIPRPRSLPRSRQLTRDLAPGATYRDQARDLALPKLRRSSMIYFSLGIIALLRRAIALFQPWRSDLARNWHEKCISNAYYMWRVRNFVLFVINLLYRSGDSIG